MREPMLAGRLPATVAEHERLAERYQLPSAWAGLRALRAVVDGRLTWHDWLPDGIHPQVHGSTIYAECVSDLLRAALAIEAPERVRPLPPPLDPRNWSAVEALPWDAVATTGAWFERRVPQPCWMGRALTTVQPHARLSAPFRGRGLCVGGDFGRRCADFRWRIDGGAWHDVRDDRPAWLGERGWYRVRHVGGSLRPGAHRFELETLPAVCDGVTASNFTLCLLGPTP
jgi:hypothetical protein